MTGFDLDDSVLQAPTEPPFLNGLNPEQRTAVLTTEGPVLVLSGAGTGKTRVLTTRIAYIIAAGLARPWEILATTFTNKAAKAMKDRLIQMIGADGESVGLGTFHGIGARILRKHAAEAGLTPNFVILNSDDQERLLKQIMQEVGIDTKQYAPKIMLDIIQRWKDRGLMPDAVSAGQLSDFCEGRGLGLYQLYQKRLGELGAVDFGDLLLLLLELFKNNAPVLAHYQNQFRYILVDEYQDTNVAQYMLLRLLARGHNNLCCVGDDDQSIYSWRGAEVDNILNFGKAFPDALIVRLEQNYRSTGHILGAAAGLIARNAGRLGKTLKVADTRDGAGEKVAVRGFWSGDREAQKIVELIENRQRLGTPLSHMAILVRASFQTRAFEETLIRAGMPYKIFGGFKFYEREEIRDAVAYLRLIENNADDLAFLRIVNKPRRGIGDQAVSALVAAGKEKSRCLLDAIAAADLRPAPRKTLEAFAEKIAGWAELARKTDLVSLAKRVLEESGYIAMWRDDKSADAPGRLENITEFYNVLSDFETLQDFLEYVALITDADDAPDGDALMIMTLHASKGLEFEHVYLPGWEEGLFPHQKALDESGAEGLEEERRLAYVGITRAQKSGFISYAGNRRVYGQWQNALPSRFIDELPAGHVQADSEIRGGVRAEPSFFTWGKSGRPDFSAPRHAGERSARVGKRVHHELFGDGIVIRADGDRLEVHFDAHGSKKILARFLTEL
ncbi:MAG: UvrD-helicase domain-containing protein [Alphaproteobacteria bacterium]|nr:UvrD-helicase domain-containing protein [Alphaproteobacteria bacterium]